MPVLACCTLITTQLITLLLYFYDSLVFRIITFLTEVAVVEPGSGITEVASSQNETLPENLSIDSVENDTPANVSSDTVTGTACMDVAMLAKWSMFDITRTITNILCYIPLSGACIILACYLSLLLLACYH